MQRFRSEPQICSLVYIVCQTFSSSDEKLAMSSVGKGFLT
jgi:hypothetical protein